MQNLSICTKSIRTLDGLFSLNDLHSASGRDRKHQPSNFIRLEQTKELITEIDKSSELRINGATEVPVIKSTQGRNGGTYACKELVYAYAMWISAKFHLHVIRAFDAIQQAPAPATHNIQRMLTTIEDGAGSTYLLPEEAMIFYPTRKHSYLGMVRSMTDAQLINLVRCASITLYSRLQEKHGGEINLNNDNHTGAIQ